jgi:hypothetical protein
MINSIKSSDRIIHEKEAKYDYEQKTAKIDNFFYQTNTTEA